MTPSPKRLNPKRLIVALCPFLGFGDRPLNLLGHPYALARTALRGALGSLAPLMPAGLLLDVGCGTMPYRALFPGAAEYIGTDFQAGLDVDVVADAHSLSEAFAPESFDAIISLSTRDTPPPPPPPPHIPLLPG